MPGKWDGKTRPSNDEYRKNFDEIFGQKEKEELELSYKQSLANKKERTDRFPTAEERWPRQGEVIKKMYEIWYIPRIQDELVVARFDNINDTYDHMDKIRIARPKAYPHHYIWDPEKKEKVEQRSL